MNRRILVRCAVEGQRMPLPASCAPHPRYVTGETPAEVIFNSFVRRRLRRGDLVEVAANAKPAKKGGK